MSQGEAGWWEDMRETPQSRAEWSPGAPHSVQQGACERRTCRRRVQDRGRGSGTPSGAWGRLGSSRGWSAVRARVIPGPAQRASHGLSLVPSPQDAEISAFELQTILRRVLAKRKCPLLAKPSPRPASGPRWLRHGSLCSHTNATGHHWHRGRRRSAG